MNPRSLSILVVDDDALSLRLVSRQLDKLGDHRVDAVTGGDEALARLTSSRYDLVLLDLIMPRVNGIDVLRWIARRPQLDSTRVIVISAEDSQSSRQAAWAHGASDVLLKPFSTRTLQRRISRLSSAPRLRPLAQSTILLH